MTVVSRNAPRRSATPNRNAQLLCLVISILAGSDAYQDPWHPFPETAARLRDVLTRIPGTEVAVTTGVDDTLNALDAGTSLLVLNLGNAGPGTPTADAREQLTRWLGSGGALLAVHVAATAFRIGKSGSSCSADVGCVGQRSTRRKRKGQLCCGPSIPWRRASPTSPSTTSFYTDLRFRGNVQIIAEHTWDNKRHPLAWTTTFNDGRVAYVALGHDTDAFDSAEFRELLLQTTRWLLAAPRND